jgi:hypothetical protein
MNTATVQPRRLRHTSRRAPWLSALALVAGAGSLQAAVIRVGLPGEPGCDQPSLQAAINAAAAAPGLDIIRVSVGTHSGVLLQVNESGPLAIEGGYLSCSTPVANAGTTTLSAQGTPGGSVINHIGSGALTLSDLSLTGGNASAGGGLHSPGAAPLTLVRVHFFGNWANAGGGLAVIGVAGPPKQVDLLGVGFTSNIAGSIGGGIYAIRAAVRIAGDSPNHFTGNWAQGTNLALGGGAIYANNSTLLIHSLPPAVGAFMDSNLATQGSGGAIAFIGSTPGFYSLTVMNRDGSRPLTIANNAAARGGAISVQTWNATGNIYTNATLFNAIIEDNQATDGILHVDAYNTSHASNGSLVMQPSTVGMVAPPCPASLRCNRVQGNDSTNSVVTVNSGGGFGNASFLINRGHLVDNASQGGSLLFGTGYVGANNSVLANNLLPASNLVGAVGSEVSIQNSTIAGNSIGPQHVFAVILPGGILTVHNSIVYQPGKAFHQVGTPVLVNLRNLLVNPDHGLANIGGLNIQGNLLPSFVNPGQHDFQLQPGSQARNRWAPGGGVQVPSIDLPGGTRPADPPGTPTPYDFGAYEYGSIVDAMFVGTFEG